MRCVPLEHFDHLVKILLEVFWILADKHGANNVTGMVAYSRANHTSSRPGITDAWDDVGRYRRGYPCRLNSRYLIQELFNEILARMRS